MSTSGTYDFNPGIGDLGIAAFARIQIRRTGILAEHLADLRMAANLVFSRWAALNGPNLWKVELVSMPLVPTVATYTLSNRVIEVLDAYIETGVNPPTDRIITSVSRSDYAAFPDKVTPGLPTVFWLDRQITPVIHLWQPPDTTPMVLKMYTVSRIMDAGLANGQQADLPYRFMAAFVSALAAELAMIYRPEQAAMLEAKAQKDWADASQSDVEDSPWAIQPGISGYFR